MDNRTEKRKIGDLGEGFACDFLKSKGFRVLLRNYWKPWGEIDIVAQKGDLVHFVEVKSVSRACLPFRQENQDFSPEDNVHFWKRKRLARVIETYILDKDLDMDWQVDVISVYINKEMKLVGVDLLEDIEL